MTAVSTSRILLAWRPGDRGPGSAGVDIATTAAWIARSGPVLVRPVSVIPRVWPEGAGAKDPTVGPDFRDWAAKESEACLADACTALRDAGLPADLIDTGTGTGAGSTARSAGPPVSHSETTTLIDAATDFGADFILIGSRTDAPVGRFRAGATADALLHCSPLPVLTAPHGAVLSDHGITRVTCAYVDTEQSHQALRHAADLASRHGVPLRLVAFSPVGPTMYPTRTPLPVHKNPDALSGWRPQAESILARGRGRALERHPGLDVQTTVGTGDGWEDAVRDLRWKKGDLLVVGSSVLGAFNRVFIGPSTNQILRHSPAPVLVSTV